jgi:hypothetical protein
VHATLCCAVVPAINVEYFFDHVRIEGMFLDGAVQAKNGMLRPDRGRPGFGFEWKKADAQPYQIFCEQIPMAAIGRNA